MSDAKGSESSAEQTIPKSRFDEVNGEKNSLREQNQFLQNLILQQQQANRRAQNPATPDPVLEKLKSENPEMYQKWVDQEQKTKRLSAGFANLADEVDRVNFLTATGAVGKKHLAEVERILKEERDKGNFAVNRAGILQWKLGQDRLNEELTPRPKTEAATSETTTEVVDDEAPPSDPKLATTVGTTKGATKAVEKTREQVIEEFGDVEF